MKKFGIYNLLFGDQHSQSIAQPAFDEKKPSQHNKPVPQTKKNNAYLKLLERHDLIADRLNKI